MPKLKEPKTLQNLATATLERNVFRACQKAIDAIGSETTPEIYISGLQEYIYGNLPSLLSCEITVYMMSVVRWILKSKKYKILQDCEITDRKIILERAIMACVYPEITVLEMNNLPTHAQRILSCNIHTFKKLHTLIFSDILPTDVVKTLAVGLGSLNFLVNFRMQIRCTDSIIQTLGSCCSTTIEHIHVNYSEKVTDESFNNFMQCQNLKYISICDTSMTAEGYVQFLQSVKQRQKSDDTAKGFLHLGIGSRNGWDISTEQLNEMAICCPTLKQLEISKLRGDLEALISLTTLEVLDVAGCDFKCHIDCFLRQRGSNLTSLELGNTDSIDLTCIMNNCINSKILVVEGGSILRIPLEITENAAKAIQNLEVLDLNCRFSASSIECMLYACVNLTLLCLSPEEADITDEFILRLLFKNPLQKLTSFTASGSEMTMKSVNAVIEHCPLLEELKCIKCSKITDMEMSSVWQETEDNNLDLRVSFHF